MEEMSTLDRIVAEVAKVSNVENLGPDTKIGEINIDSLKFIELLLGFTSLYSGNVELDQLTVDGETTLRQLDSQLQGDLPAAAAEPALAMAENG